MNVKESFQILKRRFEQKNILFISGNVYDKYQKYDDGKPKRELISLPNILAEISQKLEYKRVEYFRPNQGTLELLGTHEPDDKEDGREFLERISNEIEDTKEMERKVYIFDLADMFFDSQSSDSNINEVMRVLSSVIIKEQKNAINITSVDATSKIVFIMRDHGNIINFLSTNNNEYAQVSISNPDMNERSDFLSTFGMSIGTADKSQIKLSTSNAHKEAIGLTSGMSYKEILQLGRIDEGESLTFKELFNLVRFNKVESEWEKLDYEQVKNLSDILSRRVLGQKFATKEVERTLKTSLLGLNGAMHGNNNNKPKGILFFAGPTGVGKTELAKALTDFVFKDQTRIIRFDMSEFAQEHSDQRLIGAPPGFVGYNSGGELTNAVRNEPQSIILFDEIEKAHSKILDKFLQILEDGRLTSAKGELIDFSETMIIFTSNIGSKHVSPKNSEEQNRSIFKKAVADHFKLELKRPEILNRIGMQNIIPFNYISSDDILKLIFKSKLSKLYDVVKDKHNIILAIDTDEENEIFEIVKSRYDKHTGGRGLITTIEIIIQNAFIDFMFDNNDKINNDKTTHIIISSMKNKIYFTIL